MANTKSKVSKLWWWNRFLTWFYHWSYDIECDKNELSKLCPRCKSKFEKWLKEKEANND